MIFGALAFLVLIDGTLIGHHAAIGVNPLLHKDAFWRRAYLRGFLASLVSLSVIGVTTAVTFGLSSQPGLMRDAAIAAEHMLYVVVPYAGIHLCGLALFFTPWKLLTNILVLGPFTMLREPMLLASVALGVWASPRWEVVLILTVASLTTLSIKPLLRRHPLPWP